MAVVIETTLGDITVDLFVEQRPQTCINFLKLCKLKYYNFNLFHTIQSGFIAQTGDPTGDGSGGESIWGVLHGSEKRYFCGEKLPKIRHTTVGLLSMVCSGESMVGSQFFFTLAPDLDSLDGVHCVIGEVTEGHEVLRKLNDTICDEGHRPYQDVRITHTVILEDPFNDPANFRAPSRSPSPSAERLAGGRIAPDEELDETKGKSLVEIQELIEEKEAKARATILEIVGDLPDVDVAPPENVLFVCKLNPVTSDDDLEIIFSRFGKIVSCEVIRDKKTGDSLQYAFIEFADKKSCEDAYFKMDNVLIDDRRIHVDFSQSVSKIKWLGKGRGVKIVTDENANTENKEVYVRQHNHSKSISRDRDRKDRNRRHERTRDHSVDKSKRSHRGSRSRSHNRRNRSRDRQDRIPKEKNERMYRSAEKRNNYDRDNYNISHHRRNSDVKHNSDSKSNRHKDMKRADMNSHERDREINGSKHEKRVLKTSSKREETNSHRVNDNRVDNGKIHEEARTPSPKEKEQAAHELKKKKDKHKSDRRTLKKNKKRKPSTSSSGSSESSSSSSESSSSSDSDRNIKKSRKRKRRSSTSSSSSSSSSSSTSSSDSSSDSSSTSSSDEVHKKRKKPRKVKSRKSVKKNKKK